MAIVFDCPHCRTNYRLRDEFGGKTATCKNPNCRKVIPIPMPRAPGTVSPQDLDAMAAAAFSDGPILTPGAVEMIEVTCSGCDHKWMVEAAKEGKNVLCPECRRPNRVPLRKKQEKADWRTGAGPSMARKETGLDREGAFGTIGMGGISDNTAREIVKGREAEVEPEEQRKKLIKRSVIALVVIAVVGAGGYYLFKSRKEAAADAKMEDAVKELTEATKDKDPKFEAIIFRASGEYRSRAAGSEKEAKDALLDLQKARNKAKAIRGSDADHNIILAEVAVTFTELMGTTEQVDKGARMKKDALLPEFRQTLQSITDPDARAEAIRGITRKLAADGHPTMAEEFTHQLGQPDELVGQIGLELLRLNRDAYKPQVEELLKKVSTNEAPSIQALRLVLNKPLTPKKGEAAPATSPVAQAESAALTGDFERAIRVSGKPEEKAKALAAAANVAIETNPAKATEMLKAAADLLKADAKGLVSPIIVARVCKQLTLLDRADLAESLADVQDEQTKGWARLGVLRGRLILSKDKRADDAWLSLVGDPAKVAAAAKAHEEIARHNAANGQDYQATVKSWPSGSVRPFGTAGLVLGKQDRK